MKGRLRLNIRTPIVRLGLHHSLVVVSSAGGLSSGKAWCDDCVQVVLKAWETLLLALSLR